MGSLKLLDLDPPVQKFILDTGVKKSKLVTDRQRFPEKSAYYAGSSDLIPLVQNLWVARITSFFFFFLTNPD